MRELGLMERVTLIRLEAAVQNLEHGDLLGPTGSQSGWYGPTRRIPFITPVAVIIITRTRLPSVRLADATAVVPGLGSWLAPRIVHVASMGRRVPRFAGAAHGIIRMRDRSLYHD